MTRLEKAGSVLVLVSKPVEKPDCPVALNAVPLGRSPETSNGLIVVGLEADDEDIGGRR